ncbi:MAG: sigma-70 family RNA polymerase sigma factor [Clostridiales bacterium]|nr:sigma-70 family RNA polymerase sigma factor [Clostridiales bacterium]
MPENKDNDILTAVVLAQHGNKNACRDIYVFYFKKIYFICYEMTENHSLSVNLTREIFLKMFETVEKLEDYTLFEQWFYSLAVNICRESVEDMSGEPFVLSEKTEALARKTAKNGGDEGFENGIISVIESMITSLPKNIRVLFIYRYFAGLDPERISLLEHITEEEAENECAALDALIVKETEKIKEQGLDISGFTANMKNTLDHIANRKIVPVSLHKSVSDAIGVDVNPFAPSPKEKEEMEQNAKKSTRTSSSDKKSVKKNFFTKADLILFLVVLAAGLAIFAAVKYRSDSSSETTTAAVSATASTQTASAAVWNGAADVSFAAGDGTTDSPYQIATAGQLAYLANLVNSGNTEYALCSYILTADIVLNDTSDFSSWSETAPKNSWTPIGYSNSDDDHSYFMGSFNGNGHTISGIYVSSDGNYQGLFGIIRNGSVKNLNIEYSYISGGSYVGGIAGYYASDTGSSGIELCAFSGTVESSGNNAGGIVGYVRCEGENASITLSQCCASGIVAAVKYAGGIAGVSESASGSILIENSYSTASVTASGSAAGGIAGVQRVSDGNSQIKYCCNLGNISGESDGGIAGECSCVTGSGLSEVAYCYWLVSSASAAFNNGSDDEDRLLSVGVEALEEYEMREEKYMPELDFTKIWEIDSGGDYPYPTLQDMNFGD